MGLEIGVKSLILKRGLSKMRYIHINNSYKIWKVSDMKCIIRDKCRKEFRMVEPYMALNRSYYSLYIEWWLHNIGYYITKPFCSIKFIHRINLRCKDVDLEEWD